MRSLLVCTSVAFLCLMLIPAACATPGRLLFTGCHPLVADPEGPGLFVADPDGFDVVRLLASKGADPGPWCMTNPDWSPDSRRLVFQHNCQLAVWDLKMLLPGPWEYWFGECAPWACCCPWYPLMNPEPTPIHPCGWGPKWSPAGDRIAFSDGSVCMINPDGSGYRSLTPGGWGGLTWSADGLSIVFADEQLRSDLCGVTDLDGPGDPTVVQYTNTPGIAEHRPVMSPDGLELAFSEGPAVTVDWDPLTDPLPPAGVRVADYPGFGAVRVLTDDAGYHDYVSNWTPDGQYVYFFREYSGSPQERPVSRTLWRVKADGSQSEEPVPGMVGWDKLWGDMCFMKEGVYGTSTYALPGYTGVPLAVGVVGAENLAGLQARLLFKTYHMYSEEFPDPCCPVLDTVDSCGPGPMISHWAMAGPIIDQDAGTMDIVTYGADPGSDAVSGLGELLELAAAVLPYSEVEPEFGQVPLLFDSLQLSDDWGEPIETAAIPGGVVLKPFSYLELSEVPPLVLGDEADPVPIPMTITARGDMDEALSWPSTEVRLYLEASTTDEWGRTFSWAYADAITPTTAALVNGAWTGEVEILEPVEEGARIAAKYADFGGYSNPFEIVGKGDVNADDDVNVFDVIKIANMAIGRGTWESWQWWAADLNADEEVNIFDVVLCANAAMSAMGTSAVGRAGVGRAGVTRAAFPAEPAGAVVVTTASSSSDGQTSVVLNLSDCAGVAGIQLELSYDARRLASPAVTPGPLLDGRADWTVLSNDTGGSVRAIAYTSSGDVLRGGDGAILIFVFESGRNQSGKVNLESVTLSTARAVEIPAAIGKTVGKGKQKDKKGAK